MVSPTIVLAKQYPDFTTPGAFVVVTFGLSKNNNDVYVQNQQKKWNTGSWLCSAFPNDESSYRDHCLFPDGKQSTLTEPVHNNSSQSNKP